MSTRFIVIGILVAGLIVAGSIAVVEYRPGAAQAAAVEVREEGVVVSSARAEDAIAEVSGRVGFEVKLPTYVPAGLTLVSVDSMMGPEGASNALKIASLTYAAKDKAKRGSVSVVIHETGVRTSAPDGRAQKIDLGVPGVDAYFQAVDRGVGYWLFTADRGYTIGVIGQEPPTDGQMRAMIASLAK